MRQFILRAGTVAIVVSFALATLRFVEVDQRILLGLVPIAPWMFLAVSIVTAAVYSRRVFLAVVTASAVGIVLAMPGAVIPRTGCTTAHAIDDHDVVVYSHNAYVGGADPEMIAAQVESVDADIVVIQEADSAFVERFGPLLDEHPHHAQDGWLSIFSRWEFADDQETGASRFVGAFSAVVSTPGGDIRVVNVHSPWPLKPGGRAVQIEHFELLTQVLVENDTMAVVALGDFNATPSDARYRALTSAEPASGDIVDAHRVAGCGFGVTWTPVSGLRPSLLSLDHAIVSGASVEGFEILGYAGADHKGIAVHVSLED